MSLYTGSSSNIMKENEVYNNSRNGIYLDSGSSKNVICDNIIHNNEKRGIALYSASNAKIINNIIYNHTEDGINLAAFSNNTIISNNEISNSTFSGISLAYVYNTTISYNTIHDNLKGISLLDSINNSITNNAISYSYSSGISLHGISELNIASSNHIFNNTEYGFYLDDSPNNIFSGNFVFNNSKHAIRLSSTTNDSNIKWNNFLGNNNAGVQGQDSGLNNLFSYNYWDDATSPDDDQNSIVDDPYVLAGLSSTEDISSLTIQHALSQISIIKPIQKYLYDDNLNIQWTNVSDSYNHSITYTIFYSNDGEVSWNVIQSGISDLEYQWDTSSLPNGDQYIVKVVAEDGNGLRSIVISSKFRIRHLTDHGPIAITDNIGFHSQAASEGWDLGGTRDGTKGNPYVISGYNITTNSGILIYISNTDVHFEVKGNYLNGIDNSRNTLVFSGVNQGIITNNVICNSDSNIRILTNTKIRVTGNIIHNSTYGIYVAETANTQITYNRIYYTGTGIRIDSNDNIISSNTIYNNNIGIAIGSLSSNNTINHNTVYRNSEKGIYLFADANIITYNSVYENQGYGIEIVLGERHI
ncbi:MAG: right-handed parallel beta-helix repeat-containing protein, partial [Candidatus Kariarchaeaceae archaeon]